MAPTDMKKVSEDEPTNAAGKKSTKITPIGSFGSIEEFAKTGLAEIVDATRAVNAFPQGAARDLYCAYPTFGRVVDEQCDHILDIISKVLKWQNIKGNIQRRQQDEQFEMLLECNDAVLERLNSNLDDLAGIKKAPATVVIETRMNAVIADGCVVSAGRGAGSWNMKKHTDGKQITARLITAKNIARPQMKFRIPVDNSGSRPFVPKIKEKPNSLKPLAILPEYDDAGDIVSYLHPYEFELSKFEVSNAQLGRRSPQTPPPVDATELVYVKSIPQLKLALEDLRQHKEIAVDVEHHSYRTFLGFTCLIQISTRSKDYIFDALELREDLQILNEIFTDPTVVKIFHGADLDIEWLQRDLSLYVVNMFDTHQAAKALNMARLSLAFLLKHYCQIEADKTFQLSDWRIRPLPDELVAYARQDTHFLIYIFERITNDLLDAANQQSNMLANIYHRSTELCKKRYVKPIVGPESHMDLFRKSKRNFDNRQHCALRELFIWRDGIARAEDESIGYVLPNHMMLQIAESLPREMHGILACCNPIPPLVRQHLHTMHQIVLRARQQPLAKPDFETDSIQRVASTEVKDLNNKLNCPHDLSHCPEFRDDLPTLLNSNDAAIDESEAAMVRHVKMSKPSFGIFEILAQSQEENNIKMKKLLLGGRSFSTVTPYQRYLAVLPLAEQEKRNEAARIDAELSKRQLCPVDSRQENKNIIADQTVYALPTQETLKRKHEETTNAPKPTTSDPPPLKRVKTETPGKNKSLNRKPSLNKQRQAAKVTEAHDEETIVIEDDSDAPPEEKPSTSKAHPQQQNQPQSQQRRKRQRSKRNRKGKQSNGQQHNQSSDRPVMPATSGHFDFQKVDAKRFRGGAQRAKGTEFKPQFHGKSKSNKANNKKFNKLFTFDNAKGKK